MKKKFITLTITVLAIISMLSTVVAFASSNSCGNSCTYTINNNELIISGTGAVTDNSAWVGNTTITSIEVEEGITELPERAFKSMSNVKTLTLPSTLQQIPSKMCFACNALEELNISEGTTTIGANSFSGCVKLTNVVIPEGVTSIGSKAFGTCNSLTSISLPSTIKTIGDSLVTGSNDYAVTYNGSISDYESLNVGNNKFEVTYLTTSNKSVLFEGKLTDTISYYVYNTGLLDIFGSGSMPDYNISELPEYYSYIDNIESVVIEDGITSIGSYSFYNMNIASVVIGDSVYNISNHAFYECEVLVNFDFNNVNYVDDYAFYGCKSLLNTYNGNSGYNSFILIGDETNAFNFSKARLDAAYTYLNNVYFNNDIIFDIDYCTPADIEELKSLAAVITKGCTTDKEKCDAIFNWMDANIKYTHSYFMPMDVLHNMAGICSGHAQLCSSLFKVSGIPATVVRGYKIDSVNNTIGKVYEDSYSCSHEWVMAYVNNDWYCYDDLWSFEGTNDRNVIAAEYFLVNVDGIQPYTSAGIDTAKCESNYNQTYYINGEFIGYKNGVVTSDECANANVGGNLSYMKYYYTPVTDVYYTSSSTNSHYGYALSEGWYTNTLAQSNLKYIRCNGVAVENSFRVYNDEYYYLNHGSSLKLTPTSSMTITKGKLGVAVGSSIDLSSYTTVNCASSAVTITNNIVNFNNVGEVEITVDGLVVEFAIYDPEVENKFDAAFALITNEPANNEPEATVNVEVIPVVSEPEAPVVTEPEITVVPVEVVETVEEVVKEKDTTVANTVEEVNTIKSITPVIPSSNITIVAYYTSNGQMVTLCLINGSNTSINENAYMVKMMQLAESLSLLFS